MIEKDIEANIIAAVEALGLDGLDVRGAWQAAAEGGLKDEEADDAPAALAVAVSPRSFETFGICVATFPVTLSLAVRADKDPEGSSIETYAAPIADLLARWNFNLCDTGESGMAVDGFNLGSIHVSGGSAPFYDADAGVWTVSWEFTLRGYVEHSGHGSESET